MLDLKNDSSPPSRPKLWKYWKVIFSFRAVTSCSFVSLSTNPSLSTLFKYGPGKGILPTGNRPCDTGFAPMTWTSPKRYSREGCNGRANHWLYKNLRFDKGICMGQQSLSVDRRVWYQASICRSLLRPSSSQCAAARGVSGNAVFYLARLDATAPAIF